MEQVKFDEFCGTMGMLHDAVKENVATDGGAYPHVLVVGHVGDQPKSMCVTIPNYPADHKHEIMRQIGSIVSNEFPGIALDALGMSSEAWTVSREASSPNMDVPPSEDPDKKECVATTAHDMEGNSLLIISFFTRTSLGSVVWADKDTRQVSYAQDKGLHDSSLLRSVVEGMHAGITILH